jgi:hypothetical protein
VIQTSPASYWRIQAAQIVADLFPVTSTEVWNQLLDFRSELLRGEKLEELLNLFLESRHLLEADHYLPFYRLRRLLESSLRLDATFGQAEPTTKLVPLRPLLWETCRTLEEIRKSIHRHHFEHDLSFSSREPLHLEVKEVAGSR